MPAPGPPPTADSGPYPGSTACSGCGIRPTTRPAASLTPAIATARAVGVGAQVAEHDPALALELVEGALVGDVAALPVLQRDDDLLGGLELRRPRGVARSTRSRWSRHTNVRWSLRTRAPGSRCDSQSTWKPLQIPSTGSPRARRPRVDSSPARSGRSRRSAGSRRRRSRRAARPRPRRAGRRRACHSRTASPPARRTARAASPSSREPGKVTTPTRIRRRPRRRRWTRRPPRPGRPARRPRSPGCSAGSRRPGGCAR